ncbi:MAG: RNA polymerase sigma factor [Acidimicrobiia bacterium]|nr:RNA polymerase sigma factor [Acidimicrobiia bacterium]
MAAARSGAEWAVTALYRSLQPSLVAYLRALDPAEAEDLASEVWLGIGRNLANFDGDEGAFRGWVFTIARRRVVDHRRRRGRRQTDPVPAEALVAIAAADDPEAAVLDVAAADEVRRLIADLLPPDQADAVLLRVVAGLDAGQIATILGKRPGAVRVLQHRALRTLAKEFSSRGVTK